MRSLAKALVLRAVGGGAAMRGCYARDCAE